MGKMRTVCVCITENARWKMGILSKDIAAILLCTELYLHPKSSHALYVQYKRVSTMFFNVLFYMGKLRTVCVCSAKNVLSEDIAVILLCTAPYLHPKSSHTLYDQYKRVSSCFLTLYYTISKCILHVNSACSMRFQCTKCASKEGCFIRRYRSDPAMYSTVPAPKK